MGSFETLESSPGFPNIPTDYHGGAATVGFADGHVEVHKWHDGGLLTPQTPPIVQKKLAGGINAAERRRLELAGAAQHASQHR